MVQAVPDSSSDGQRLERENQEKVFIQSSLEHFLLLSVQSLESWPLIITNEFFIQKHFPSGSHLFSIPLMKGNQDKKSSHTEILYLNYV